jgi:hypothetical protein
MNARQRYNAELLNQEYCKSMKYLFERKSEKVEQSKRETSKAFVG